MTSAKPSPAFVRRVRKLARRATTYQPARAQVIVNGKHVADIVVDPVTEERIRVKPGKTPRWKR